MLTSLARCAAVCLGLVWSAVAQQSLLATVQGDEPGDRFGAALAVTGDVDGDGVADFIVGAPHAGTGGVLRGKAWVFSGATHSPLHLFEGRLDEHQFGFAVAGAGDVDADGHEDLVVGEPWPEFTASAPGKAFVLSGADGHLLHLLSGSWPGDSFGYAVAGVGDVNFDGHADIAVGAPNHGCGFGFQCDGRVVVFSGADGAPLVVIPGWSFNMGLGAALEGLADVDGDGAPDFLAGAPYDGGFIGYPYGAGAVYVLSGAAGAPLVSAFGPFLLKDSANTGTTLGVLGDVDGDGVADFYGGGTEGSYTGSLSFFSGASGSTIDEIHVTGSNPVAAALGDLDGDGLVDFAIDENSADGLAPPKAGAVRVTNLSGQTLMIQRGEAPNDLLGTTLRNFGDADADGWPEILAGAPGVESGGTEPGRVVLFEFAPLVPWITVSGDGLVASQNGFGSILRSAGDVDNDGAPDVVIGNPEDSTFAPLAGRARVYSGRDGSVLLDVHGELALERLGWSVDGAGDIDRDGYADIVAGIPFASASKPGAVRIFSGKTGAVLLEADGPSLFDGFGVSVAGVGDTNGDLVPDVLVGAQAASVAPTTAGAAYLVSGADGSVLHAFKGSGPNQGFGSVVGGGGDTDADGVPDLLVGVPNEPVGTPAIYPGVVRLYSGATGALLHVFTGTETGGHFGMGLDDAGDVDGDGHDDIVIGAPFAGLGNLPGKADVYSGATGELLWSYATMNGPGNIGQSVAGMGDMDGDGLADVLVGAPTVAPFLGTTGEARLLSGADGSVIQAYARETGTKNLGILVDRAGDFDLDGRSEVLVSATKAPDKPDGEFTLWLSGDGSSPWSNLGAVLPGAHGPPSLLPSGSLIPGEPVTLTLSDTIGSAPVAFVVGLTVLGVPFKGGTLVPHPEVVIVGLTDASGMVGLTGHWPGGVPAGQAIYVQALIPDATALKGYAASNAVQGVVP